VTNRRWHDGNRVLVGDAAHTAHFSIGSGTKLAMEDCIALADALAREPDVPAALAAYEQARRPEVEALQRAAQVSLEWFEHTERYMKMAPLQFTYSLLTRSLRVSHDSLRKRDAELVRRAERWFADQAAAAAGVAAPAGEAPPPVRAPLRVGDRLLAGRIVPRTQVAALAAGGAVAVAGSIAEADRLRNQTGATVLLDAGLRSLDHANGALLAGRADLVVIDDA
jgi:anthraniloyl-CoA monooxygenase